MPLKISGDKKVKAKSSNSSSQISFSLSIGKLHFDVNALQTPGDSQIVHILRHYCVTDNFGKIYQKGF